MTAIEINRMPDQLHEDTDAVLDRWVVSQMEFTPMCESRIEDWQCPNEAAWVLRCRTCKGTSLACQACRAQLERTFPGTARMRCTECNALGQGIEGVFEWIPIGANK